MSYSGNCASEAKCDDPCTVDAPKGVDNSKIRNTLIEQVDNGYIVRVGCKTFVVREKSDLLRLLDDYMSNPTQVEYAWREGKFLV